MVDGMEYVPVLYSVAYRFDASKIGVEGVVCDCVGREDVLEEREVFEV
jgi:hypothetical protein